MVKHEPGYTREKLNAFVTANPLLRGFFNCYIEISGLFLEPVSVKRNSAPNLKSQNVSDDVW